MLFVTVIGLGLLAIVHAQCPDKTVVAFTAGLTKDVTIGANNRVLYDKIITNHGNSFDSSTGQFTAPVSGIYGINLHVLSQSGAEAWIDLVLNDQYIASTFASQPSSFDAAGNSVKLVLKKGDILFTRARREAKLYGRYDEMYATLSVYLVATV